MHAPARPARHLPERQLEILMKIALLADRSVQAKAIADSLSRAGVSCHTYHASRELFHGIDRSGYDVLLIDHELADMPAVEAVRAVRGVYRCETPVMVLSEKRAKTRSSTPCTRAPTTT